MCVVVRRASRVCACTSQATPSTTAVSNVLSTLAVDYTYVVYKTDVPYTCGSVKLYKNDSSHIFVVVTARISGLLSGV